MSAKSIALVLLGFLLTASMGLAGPIFNEGVAYDLRVVESNPGLVTTAGDIVLCEPTVVSCSVSTPTSQWSDVLVFYNPTAGPFTPDSTLDANSAYVFSNDDTGGPFGGLANFLTTYVSLSANASAISENPSGPTIYADFYTINSSDVPEPASWGLMMSGLGALAGMLRRRRHL